MTQVVMNSKRELPFKVTFADGTYTVVDAHSTFEATQMAKNKSGFTTIRTTKLTQWEAEVLERRLYSKPKEVVK
jgi:hypothetical protein